MKLQDIYTMAENWRTADNKRYSVEFYSRVIADLIDRKQYAKRFVVNMIENIK